MCWVLLSALLLQHSMHFWWRLRLSPRTDPQYCLYNPAPARLCKLKTPLVLQVPSNLVLLKLGGRLWLGSLVIAWGTVAACCAFMRTRWQFFVLRIALGCAEAGTMPGMW